MTSLAKQMVFVAEHVAYFPGFEDNFSLWQAYAWGFTAADTRGDRLEKGPDFGAHFLPWLRQRIDCSVSSGWPLALEESDIGLDGFRALLREFAGLPVQRVGTWRASGLDRRAGFVGVAGPLSLEIHSLSVDRGVFVRVLSGVGGFNDPRILFGPEALDLVKRNAELHYGVKSWTEDS